MHLLPIWQVGSDITTVVWILGNQLLLRVSFVKNRELLYISRWSHPPCSSTKIEQEGQFFFSSFYCENPIQCLEVNLTKCGTLLQQLGPLELLFFRLTPTDLPASCQIQVRFPTPVLGPRLVSLCKDHLSKLTGRGLLCILTPLRDFQRAANFLVCSAFHLLLG